ncbi:MAG: hypothetical protein M0R66_07310 [Candidatus Omnitrophica bacterium]|jgi:PKD repeat protein|nr:hypothetical protein [Candidatus Omnitrophota bacterium]
MTIFRPKTLAINPTRRSFLCAGVVPFSTDGGLIQEVINGKTFTPYRGDAPYSRILSPFGPAMKANGTTTRLCWDTDDSKEWQVTKLPDTFWGVVAFRYNLEGGGGTAQTDRLMAELRGTEDTLKMDTSGTGDYAGALHFDRADDSSGAIFRTRTGILVPGQWYIVAAKFGTVEDDVELWVNGQREALTKEGTGFVKQWGRMTLHGGWNVNAMAAVLAYRGSEIPIEAKLDPWWAFRPSTPEVYSIPFELPDSDEVDPAGMVPHFAEIGEEVSSQVFLATEYTGAADLEARYTEEGEDPVLVTAILDGGTIMVTMPAGSAPASGIVEIRVRQDGKAWTEWTEVPGGWTYYSSNIPLPSPEGTAVIALSRSSGPGPLGLVATASGSSWTGVAKPFHHLAYIWDFDDPTGFKTECRGPVAGHVFETPGSYTVKLRVFRPGLGYAEASAEVTVTDADTVFDGKTYVFANEGSDFVGKPAGAVEVTTDDFDEVIEYAAAGYRCLLRRGDTFTVENTPAHSFSGSTIQVGAFGAAVGDPDALGRYGNDPIVTMTGTATSQYLTPAAAVNGLTFFSIRFRDLGTGGYRWGHGPTSWNNHQDHITFHKCGLEDFYSAGLLGDRTVDYVERSGIVYSRCYVKSTSYGLYIRGVKSAVLGCYLEDTAVHNVRVTLGVDFAIHDCPRIGESQDTARHSIKFHAQSASLTTPATRYVYIGRNVVEGSNNWLLSLGPQNAESDEYVEDGIFEANGIVHPADRLNQATFEISAKNVTIRQNYVVDQRSATDNFDLVLVHRRGDGLGYMPEGVEVYNNSVLSRRTGEGNYLRILNVENHTGDVLSRGNVLYAPGKAASHVQVYGPGMPVDSEADLATTSTDPLFVSEVSGSEDLRLQAGSPLIDAGGDAEGLFFDADGKLLDLLPDAGAFERDGEAFDWTPNEEGPEGIPDPVGPVPLGINLMALDHYATAKPLVNLCKMAAPWAFWDGTEEVVPEDEDLDADGYPIAIPEGIEIAYSVVQADFEDSRRVPEAVELGEHVLTYDGTGTVDLVLSPPGDPELRHSAVVSGFRFDNPNGFIKLEVSSIAPADHPRNFRIAEARFEGVQGSSFTPEFLQSLAGFKTIRGADQWWVDAGYDSAKGELTWANRTQATAYTFVGSAARAAAWPPELMVELVNAIDGADLYYMVPYLASDTYVAGLVAAWAGLKAGKKVWIEYTGEPWQGLELAGHMKNCDWLRAQAAILFGPNPEDPILLMTDQLKAHAHHGTRIFDLILADENYDETSMVFVAAYPSWVPNHATWLGPVLDYELADTPWSDYLAGVLTSFYWGAAWPGGEVGFDAMLDACNGDHELFATFFVFPNLSAMLTTTALLEAFSAYLTSKGVASGGLYEFGPYPNHGWLGAYERVDEFIAIWKETFRSSRIRTMMVYCINALSTWLNADLPACHYGSIGPYLSWRPWTMAEDFLDLSSPRLVALRSFFEIEQEWDILDPVGLSPNYGDKDSSHETLVTWPGLDGPLLEGFNARIDGSLTIATAIELNGQVHWKIQIPISGTARTATIEISPDAVHWYTVPDGFRYTLSADLLPTGLAPSSGSISLPWDASVLWGPGGPPAAAEFFARLDGELELETLIEGEDWTITMPSALGGMTQGVHTVEISVDGMTWVEVPGGWTGSDVSSSSLVPAGLSPAFGPDDAETVLTLSWSILPPEVGTFLARVVGDPTPLETLIDEGTWTVTLPLRRTGYHPLGVSPNRGPWRDATRVRISVAELLVAIEISLDGVLWVQVPGVFRWTGYPTAAAFFGQAVGDAATLPATAPEIGADGRWRMVLPVWAGVETVEVQTSFDGMTWYTDGPFDYFEPGTFIGMAFLAYQAARGRIGE